MNNKKWELASVDTSMKLQGFTIKTVLLMIKFPYTIFRSL